MARKSKLEKLPSDYNEFEGIPLGEPIPSVEDSEHFQKAWVALGYDQIRFGRKESNVQLLFKKIDCIRLLNECETDFLIDRWYYHKDQTAVARLVEHNMLLVQHAIKHYNLNMKEKEDNFMNGILGLEQGIRKYDPTYRKNGKKMKLSTYVVQWIRQSMGRNSVLEEQLIKIPSHLNPALNDVRKAVVDLSDTMEDAILDPVRITEYVNLVIRVDKPPLKQKKVEELLPYISGTVSADFMSTGDDDNDINYLSLAQHATASEAEDLLDNIAIEQMTAEILEKVGMSEKEKTLIRLRFGLDNGGKQMAVGEIAEFIGMTSEGTRKYILRSIEKMRRYVEVKGIEIHDIM